MKRSLVSLIFLFLLGCSSENKSSKSVPDSMVLIPAGTYTMGGRSSQAYPDELPKHPVTVSAFYMDQHEVTNQQFYAFVEATNYKTIAERDIDWDEMKKTLPPGVAKPDDSLLRAGSLVFKATKGPVNLQDYSQWWQWTTGANWKHPEGPESNIENRMNHPVVHIAWDDAKAYADWANKRLPTEAEWEWAAQGGNSENIYPWGNTSIEEAHIKANFWQGVFPYNNRELDGYSSTAPILTYPENGYGLYDMAGNVWEWCEDKYDYNAYQKELVKGTIQNPEGSKVYYDTGEQLAPKHVMRGGSFLCNDSYCSGYRVSRRMSSSRDSSFNHTGFRCVQDL